MQKADELFAAIGYGKISPKQVLARLVPGRARCARKPPDGAGGAPAVRRVLGTGEEKIKVRGFDDLLVFRARCCNPIRGEKIVGYITRGKGVSVHSADLSQRRQPAVRPRAPHRRRVGQGRRDVARYTVKLTMEVEDRKGLLAAVSARIADINTNIKNMEAHTDDDRRARIDMTVEISDLKHLEKVIKSLRGGRRVCVDVRAGRPGRTDSG